MTEIEYDILDELYFPISFQALAEESGVAEPELSEVLPELVGKGWVKPLRTPDEEFADDSWRGGLASCYFLATKEGLMEHNMR
ncbi:hypothetical protein FUAX_30480 [Fulvitalea axinellae]|uniref:MarR family transcriptional regulator n=1 Tax=Fulvitalea axinellae TaxID=1182444 RepID=A0AAU9DBX3_9BACT|nr:hypothetical protein FUAX_30480 [Fulvitalea axinellae]